MGKTESERTMNIVTATVKAISPSKKLEYFVSPDCTIFLGKGRAPERIEEDYESQGKETKVDPNTPTTNEISAKKNPYRME